MELLKERNPRFRNRVLFVAVIFGSLLFIVIFTVFFILAISSFSEGSVTEENTVETQYFQYYQHKDDTNDGAGILRTPSNVFVRTFVDSSGSQHLISRFGEDEFMCSGTCFCEVESSRRISSSIPVVRGLKFLAAASSTYLAYKVANEHFKKECNIVLEDSCPSGFIRSEVSHCSSIFGDSMDSSEEEIDSEQEEEDKEEREHNQYYCTGKCLLNELSKTEKSEVHGGIFSKTYGVMERLRWSKEMFRYGKSECEKIFLSGEVSSPDSQAAKEVFSKNRLDGHCRENSIEIFNKIDDQGEYSRSMCVGFVGEGKDEFDIDVVCRRIK